MRRWWSEPRRGDKGFWCLGVLVFRGFGVQGVGGLGASFCRGFVFRVLGFRV